MNECERIWTEDFKHEREKKNNCFHSSGAFQRISAFAVQLSVLSILKAFQRLNKQNLNETSSFYHFSIERELSLQNSFFTWKILRHFSNDISKENKLLLI